MKEGKKTQKMFGPRISSVFNSSSLQIFMLFNSAFISSGKTSPTCTTPTKLTSSSSVSKASSALTTISRHTSSGKPALHFPVCHKKTLKPSISTRSAKKRNRRHGGMSSESSCTAINPMAAPNTFASGKISATTIVLGRSKRTSNRWPWSSLKLIVNGNTPRRFRTRAFTTLGMGVPSFNGCQAILTTSPRLEVDSRISS